jgi:TOMM system kinase/cyclase fusion protein
MTFDEILAQVLNLLRHEGRVSYRALKRRFDLDDEDIADLKAEIIQAKKLAIDEDGAVLVWSEGAIATPGLARDQRLEPRADVRKVPEAERRQLTVMFCDLVGSTALSGQLDPEDLREVIRSYQETCAEAILRFDGYIAKYLGDGVLIYFGYPQAHEDDAQRAVRAGLKIVEGMQALNARLQPTLSIPLAVRLGIHTGLVVTGEMGGGETREPMAIVGETPNIAARLQDQAEPNTVIMSASTYRLVHGVFACRDLGPRTLKGVVTPVLVYRVLDAREDQGRFDDVAVPSGLTPLVGREREVGLLLDRWEQVKDGLGQVVVLNGEAGIGKSRLVEVLKAQVAGEPHVRWECRGSPYHQNSAFYPVIDLFHRALRFQRDEVPAEKLRKLETTLDQYGCPLEDMVPLFASLLSFPLLDRYPPLTLTPQRQKQKTMEALSVLLLGLAVQQPVLLIVEDLHWVDPSTLDLLCLLVDQGATVRILMLFTYRPEFRPPWSFRAHLTPIVLGRLPRLQIEAMVEQVAGRKALPAEVRRQIVANTDGVPLFVEELTKMVLESGWLHEREDHYELIGPLPSLAIPTTLHDSLMARLDRLAPVKEVAQLGATLGRVFPYELLRAVSPLEEGTLRQALAQLVEAELLYQRGILPQATYHFKHALIQEEAYQSLLKSTRQRHHAHIAQVLVERFPETAATQPELLAQHYTGAGLIGQAIPYWQQAGQKAIECSATVEAIRHLSQGLELLETLPDTPERTRQELALQTILGPALMATKGYAAFEVETTYNRSHELCRQMGETPQLLPILFGLWVFHFVRADLQMARELAEQIMRLAQSLQDPDLLLEAHLVMGSSVFFVGECESARAHFEHVMALYDPQQHRSHAALYGQDPGACSLSLMSWAQWLLGYPDQALKGSRAALTLAHELAHPYSLIFALSYAGFTHQFLQERQAVQEQAEAIIALSIEQGFTYWLGIGMILRGWALVEQGQGEEGIAQIRQGLTSWQATGANLARTYYLALLAETYRKAELAEAGLTVLAEALAAAHTHGELWCEAELQRLKGELLLGQAEVGKVLQGARTAEEEAETYFQQALAIARRQQANSWELRAATSMARLWQRQGKRAEAHELLAPIYSWFTEGFETVDLQEAKALLEELST